ncbi:hypothetical protein Anas_07695 [Armadillidium nasatum]|uniref:Uncharacterized protein n=1 Tax=Armadillidium nasatum TaxID=96803 RepID=A0A5N5T4D3_9CRUS|nr:hypothetical protein Anas_07695 [Armadillidium nasatum]
MSDIYEDVIFAQSEIEKLFEKHRLKNTITLNVSIEDAVLSDENQSKTEDDITFSLKDDIGAFAASVNELLDLKAKLVKLQENFLSYRINEYSYEILSQKENVLNKNLIAWYLQQPLVNNFLRVHHSHIGNLKELLEKIVKILQEFEFHLQSLTRIQDLNLEQTESHIFQLTQLLEAVRTTLKQANNLCISICN